MAEAQSVIDTWKRVTLARIDAEAKKELSGGIEGLKNAVSSPAMLAALGVLQYDMNNLALKILGTPLDSQEAIYRAARMQGKSEGILHSISTLIDLATLEIEVQDNGN